MDKIEIKNRYNGEIIISGKYGSIKDALEKNRHANLEGANLRHADLRHANLEGADLEGANLEGADLRHADLRHANLRGANLEGANLRHADLRHANLEGADLEHADLEHAYLEHAYLRGANLEGADLDSFYLYLKGSCHSVSYYNNYITIGCESFEIKDWEKNYKKIGEKNGYTAKQIEEYGIYIKTIKQLTKRGNNDIK